MLGWWVKHLKLYIKTLLQNFLFDKQKHLTTSNELSMFKYSCHKTPFLPYKHSGGASGKEV
jgi:hypothetical protein